MPINYYCAIAMNGSDIEMNKNQLQLPVIDNESSAPSSPIKGQMYYDTGTNIMYFYNDTSWVEMDGTGSGVSSFKATDGTYIDYSPNTESTGAVILTGDLSASGTADATTFLRGDNTWAAPAGSYTGWTADGDTGSASVDSGGTLVFDGGSAQGIATAVNNSGTGGTVSFTLDVNSLTSVTPVKTDFIAFSDEDTTGDPTRKAKIETVLALGGFIEAAGPGLKKVGTNLEVDYSSTGIINDANNGTSVTLADDDEFLFEDANGTAASAVMRGTLSQLKTYVGADNYGSWTLSDGTTTQTISSGNTVTVDAPAANAALTGIEPVVLATDTLRLDFDSSRFTGLSTIDGANDSILFYDSNNSQNASITPADIHLSQWGAAEADVAFGSNKLTGVASGTASTDGVNLGQVQGLIAGTGLFEGGYNANTGLTTDQSPNGAINGASNIATGLGDFYAVTTAGTQLGVALEVGDLIFANVAIAASSNPSNSDFTIVQSGQSIAGEGATDNATTKGIAGFNSAHFNVSANGWVSSDIYGGSSTLGIVPSGGSATTFLRGDGSWVTPTDTQPVVQTISGSGSNNTDSGITLSDSGGTVLILGAGSVSASQSGNTVTLTGTNTTYSAGVGLTLSGTEFNANVVDSQTTQAPQSVTTTTNRLYQVETDDQDNLVVNVPWSDNDTNLVTSVDEDTTAAYKGIRVNPTTGDVKVGLDINGLTLTTPAGGDLIPLYDISGTPENKKATVTSLAPIIRTASTYAATITGFGTVDHDLGSFDVIVQLYNATTYENIFACIDRNSVNQIAISGNSFPTGNIRVLVSLADAGA